MVSIQHPASIGVDPHVDTLTAAAVDRVGDVLWAVTVANSRDGIADLTSRVNGHRVTWAIEGTGTFGRALADTLIATGADVHEVPTRLTGRVRTRAGYAKTDRGDAVAIARCALTETLPPVTHHPVVEALRVLVRQRHALVNTQTRAFNRIRARLRELDPATEHSLGRLRTKRTLTRLATWPEPHHMHGDALVTAIRIDAVNCLTRRRQILELEQRIAAIMPPAGNALTAITGIGLIGAATIIAATGDITRFPTEGHYGRYCGAAPLDASSGRQQRHRLNRWGNRNLNRVLHIAIVTQIQQHGPAHTYITRRTNEGITKPMAIRAAKRHLAKHIYRTLQRHPLT